MKSKTPKSQIKTPKKNVKLLPFVPMPHACCLSNSCFFQSHTSIITLFLDKRQPNPKPRTTFSTSHTRTRDQNINVKFFCSRFLFVCLFFIFIFYFSTVQVLYRLFSFFLEVFYSTTPSERSRERKRITTNKEKQNHTINQKSTSTLKNNK